jgi:hypothetical protein
MNEHSVSHESRSRHQGHQGELLRILGVTFGVAVTIGGMIGVGILRTPGTLRASTFDRQSRPWDAEAHFAGRRDACLFALTIMVLAHDQHPFQCTHNRRSSVDGYHPY